MPNSNAKESCIIVNTSGIPLITKKQAQYFAISIFSDVKKYVKEHQAEFEQWQAKQAGEINEVA